MKNFINAVVSFIYALACYCLCTLLCSIIFTIIAASGVALFSVIIPTFEFSWKLAIVIGITAAICHMTRATVTAAKEVKEEKK